jgi:acetolactate synthase I/II/III large subunit
MGWVGRRRKLDRALKQTVARAAKYSADLRGPLDFAEACRVACSPKLRPSRPCVADFGQLNPLTAGQVIAHYLPEGAIISDEGATAGGGVHRFAANIEPHDHLALTGGAIGQGIPVATGAAVACPDRKVVCLHGDGGAMYTLQALWTQAREGLDVTTVFFANRSYAILNIELARVGAGDPGPKAFSMLDLHNPELDWVNG